MPPSVLEFIQAALQLAPVLIRAGTDLAPLAERLYVVVKKGSDPTDADWAALDAIEASQTAIIQALIPGEDA